MGERLGRLSVISTCEVRFTVGTFFSTVTILLQNYTDNENFGEEMLSGCSGFNYCFKSQLNFSDFK